MSAPKELLWSAKYPLSLDWSASLPEAPLYKILDDAIAAYPDKIAVDFLGHLYSYKEVGLLVGRAVKGLQNLGLQKGDRVGLFLPNSPTYLILYFAILKAGGVVVISIRFTPNARLSTRSMIAVPASWSLSILPHSLDKLVRMVGRTCLKKIIVDRMVDILPFPTSILYRIVKRREIARLSKTDHFVPFPN